MIDSLNDRFHLVHVLIACVSDDCPPLFTFKILCSDSSGTRNAITTIMIENNDRDIDDDNG